MKQGIYETFCTTLCGHKVKESNILYYSTFPKKTSQLQLILNVMPVIVTTQIPQKLGHCKIKN